ncbi:hypothetical protein LOC68_08310 [Blastopirellula sp. JC732]|uniref:Uncharacterized protein n=1 Tax=Blastopirellula sediminis TaxID=2894196 RepID=A0A9X1MLF8_9BACT|nr:hypothetical protein [Blastopirellula sediminis]MCC9608828.1 hypothetical protein [Blastopirellula sediminis]MCC9628395.1 hypothetical protein [Blastopirellula sediminis]
MNPTTPPSPYEQLRGSILASETLEKAASYDKGEDDPASPWFHFAAAQRVASTDKAEAEQHLRHILTMPQVESRTYLQAWHYLRALGVTPDEETRRRAIGMVVEVGLEMGVDSVAAYQDHSARYFNQAGSVIIWDTETPEMNELIDIFLDVAQQVGDNTQPWDEAHPDPPSQGMMLINILTPAGIHIGMGPMNAMQNDPMGKAVTQTALALMQSLIQATEKSA